MFTLIYGSLETPYYRDFHCFKVSKYNSFFLLDSSTFGWKQEKKHDFHSGTSQNMNSRGAHPKLDQLDAEPKKSNLIKKKGKSAHYSHPGDGKGSSAENLKKNQYV